MTKNEKAAYDIGFVDALRGFSYLEGRTIRVGGVFSAYTLERALNERHLLVSYKPRLTLSKSTDESHDTKFKDD